MLKEPFRDPEMSLFLSVKSVTRAYMKRIRSEFARTGYNITIEQWRLLNRLYSRDGCCQQDLADLAHRDKTSITRKIDSLEERGLVARIPDSEDRRQKLIYLTRNGKILREKLNEIASAVMESAEEGISPEEITVTGKTLENILGNLRG